MAGAEAKSAAEGMQVVRIPLTPLRMRACDEIVTMLDGHAKMVYYLKPADNGRYHLTFSYTWVNFHGIGEETGRKYRAPGTVVATINYLVGPGYPYKEMYEARQRIVSQGPADDFVLTATSHYTVTANGDVTFDKWTPVDTECV